MKYAFKTMFYFEEEEGKKYKLVKNLEQQKNSVECIKVPDKFKPLKRHDLQWEFNFFPTDR